MKLIFVCIKYFFVFIFKKQSLGMYIKNVAENMSIAYIKLAQILSTRSDLLSKRSIDDLKSINDNCKVLPYFEIEKILKKEYGKELFSIFRKISKSPIGSASISQVHKAILYNGDIVAVKIKRQDVVENVEKDIEFMKNFLKFLSIFSKKIKYVYNSNALDSYFNWIISETDFENEIKNINKIYEHFNSLNSNNNLENCKKMVAIKCYNDICTKNVIVMEFVEYKTLNQYDYTKDSKEKVSVAVNSALRLYFYALFNYNEIYFHGDPHTGNLYIDKDGNLGFLDYGLVFRFSKDETEIIKKLAIAIYTKNIKELYTLLMKLSQKYGYTFKERKKELKLKKDLNIYLNKIDDMNVTNWFAEMAFICIDNGLYVPKYYYEFAKSFVAIDGILVSILDNIPGEKLLHEQFIKYIVKEKVSESLNTTKLILNSIKIRDIFNLIKE